MKKKILTTAIISISLLSGALALSVPAMPQDRMYTDGPVMKPDNMRMMYGTNTKPKMNEDKKNDHQMNEDKMNNDNLGGKKMKIDNIKPKKMIDVLCPMLPEMVGSSTRPMPPMMASGTVPNLSMGDGVRNGKAMHVRILQAQLINEGYMTGTTTGNFGALTREAVKKYQKEMGIAKPTGFFGPETKEKIKARCPMMVDGQMAKPRLNNNASGTKPVKPNPCLKLDDCTDEAMKPPMMPEGRMIPMPM